MYAALEKTYRLAAAKVAGRWAICRRPVAFLFLATALLLSIYVAALYAALEKTYGLATAEAGGQWPKYRRPVAFLFLTIGLLLSIHVAHSYASMMASQRQLSEQWQQQQRSPSAPPLATSLTRVSIPKINLDVMVVEGTSHSSLLGGPGHLDDTPAPGESGNSVIAGHRDTFFRHLGDLGRGDDIFVRRAGHAYHYVVKSKEIVQPNDVAVVKPSPQNRLTLITCYPAYYIGPAPQRLVVIAEPIDDSAPNLR
jgi:sortase A